MFKSAQLLSSSYVGTAKGIKEHFNVSSHVLLGSVIEVTFGRHISFADDCLKRHFDADDIMSENILQLHVFTTFSYLTFKDTTFHRTMLKY